MTMRLGAHLRGAHLQRVVVDEARVAQQALLGGPGLHRLDDEADEAVALAAHARHHRAAVDGHAAGVTPKRAASTMACAASAAAISSLLGMQPTRAQVVP